MYHPVFIFMLTRNDSTVKGAQKKVNDALRLGIKHIGFKNVGLPEVELKALADEIHSQGAKVYLEIVSLDVSHESDAANMALRINADVIMGGVNPKEIIDVIKGHRVAYYPFVGHIVGHPNTLVGSIDEIVSSAKEIAAMEGVSGLDLLAYRFDGDVPTLIKSVCTAVDKPVYIAGSINSAARIQAVIENHAAGFTIGTAILDNEFQASKGGLDGQIEMVMEIIADAIKNRCID